ncbi:MAG: ATP-dependent DNA ligase [Chloroflexi bacterium]|nr:non-homologous end-joining DNA ligase [Chloroflexota bacterium]MDA1147298.1 non-homologous end-joining DNA ligase [Chloroflexota bacterium]MQC82467.1 ATP-dependent DNA ligase [Chloroflexota bacterium]
MPRKPGKQPPDDDASGRVAPEDPKANDAPLGPYQEMRDFGRTPEPEGFRNLRDDNAPLTFLVQKHRATALHYDVRLEVDGVLKSWPVPKGPSTDRREKRLAVMTEDHPFDCGTFEGIIPAGEYGGGEVIVWDRGTYSPDEGGSFSFHDRDEANRRMNADIAAGKVSVHLRGEKMKGSWTLVKTTQSEKSWLLIKHRDEAEGTAVELTDLDASVISWLTIADLQAGRRPPANIEPLILVPLDLPGAKAGKLPDALVPMQAVIHKEPFDDPKWLFEPKIDGVRALAWIEDGRVTLRSRRENDMTAQYPNLVASLAHQPAHTLLLDGEVAAMDDNGVPSFERLQQRLNLQNPVEVAQADRDTPVVFYVFDILHIDGVDLRRVPLEERRRILRRMLLPTPFVQFVDHFEVDGLTAYDAAMSLGLEGLVAKRRDSPYDAGKRSQRWRKVKARATADFVVGGYTRGENSRASTFGALSLGYYDDDGNLQPVGGVGSGFTESLLKDVLARLKPLVIEEMPFATAPERADVTTWVRPELVAEVEFSQITSETNLRAPVFLRLRDDKAPRDVHLDQSPPTTAVRTPAEVLAGAGAPAGDLAQQIASVEQQLDRPRKDMTLEVGEHSLTVSNLDKVMWPETPDQRALTKRDLLAYYARMAPVLLNQLRDRPLTMTRYPNGIDRPMFYQKHIEARPDFVPTVPVFSENAGEIDQDYVVVNNLPTLLWLGQLADLALHTSLARANPDPDGHHLGSDFTGSRERILDSVLNYPDFILFDLDPYIYAGYEGKGEEPELNRRAFKTTVEVALWLKELLDGAGLSSFVKTSGATGLHIYVPVLRQYDYETIRGVASTIGGFILAGHPQEVTMEWASEKRRGKVFFDANQNARIKNLACAYSPRAKPGGPVSMPLRWTELDKVYPTQFHLLNAHERVEQHGDLWAHVLDAKHDLETLLGAVGG